MAFAGTPNGKRPLSCNSCTVNSHYLHCKIAIVALETRLYYADSPPVPNHTSALLWRMMPARLRISPSRFKVALYFQCDIHAPLVKCVQRESNASHFLFRSGSHLLSRQACTVHRHMIIHMIDYLNFSANLDLCRMYWKPATLFRQSVTTCAYRRGAHFPTTHFQHMPSDHIDMNQVARESFKRRYSSKSETTMVW